LPTSQGSVIDGTRETLQSSAVATPIQSSANPSNWEEVKPTGKNPVQTKSTVHAKAGTVAGSNTPEDPNARPVPVAQSPQPAAPKAPQNSPVGIGVGAVVGGVLGNQVGSGDGKTLATILGAVGGGYIGNEIAKKNQ
jgi:uncharacterized protein YcfJ